MKSNGKMLSTSLSMTESFRPKMARPGAFLALVRKFVALFAATAFLFAFTSCSSDSGGGSDDNPPEITDVQKKAEGTYTIGETTYTVENGKVTVKKEDGTQKEVGTISKEGVITIKQDDGTTTEITAKTGEDGKTTTTVKIETKNEDGTTETKTYTGDLNAGTLTNQDDPNDTVEVKKTEPEKPAENPDDPKKDPKTDDPKQDDPNKDDPNTDPANPDNPNKPEDPNTDPKQDDPQENPNPENPNQDDPKEDPKTDEPENPEPENPEEPKPENPDEPENPDPEKPNPDPENPEPENPEPELEPEPSVTAGSFEITIDPKSTIIVKSSENDDAITLTAEEGFTGYTWLIDDGKTVTEFDGAELSADGRILTLTRESLTRDAKYPVSLLAIKNGIPYSANILVKNVTDRN